MAGLWKSIIGANMLGLEPYVLINTLRRNKRARERVSKKFKISDNEILRELNRIEKELSGLLIQYFTTSHLGNRRMLSYKNLAKAVYLNKDILDQQPDYVRWRFL